MRLYIIRHADPDYPNNTITPAGHAEAKALAERLVGEGLTRIYSSPLGRAVHTAQYTADKVGLPICIQPWTQELNLKVAAGPFAGKMLWDVHGHLFRDGSHRPELDDHYRVEIARVASESDKFLAGLGFVRQGGAYRVDRPNAERPDGTSLTGRVAIFCHNGFGLTWLAHLLDIPTPLIWSGFWLAPSSVTVVLMDQRVDGLVTPRCLHVGDVSHLHAAGLPVQRAGIIANFD